MHCCACKGCIDKHGGNRLVTGFSVEQSVAPVSSLGVTDAGIFQRTGGGRDEKICAHSSSESARQKTAYAVQVP